MADCDGTVYFSGVGKSGFVAQKVSATMVSTGAKSAWLDPTDALRGDVGVLRANDVLVLFSKSGASDELRRLVPLARAKGARVVGVTSDKRSALANDADTHVTLPLERELCPFDLAPVTSCAIQMLFGDTCAVAAMRAREDTNDDTNDAPPPPNERADPGASAAVADVMHALDDAETETERYARRRSRAARMSFRRVLVRLSSGGYGAFWWRTGNVVVRRSSWSACCTRTATRGAAEKTTACSAMAAVPATVPNVRATPAPPARAMAPENGAKVSFLPVTQDEHSNFVGIVTPTRLLAGL